MAYAEDTRVPVDKSLAEIVALVKKAGAARVAQIEEPDSFAVQFFLADRMIRFRVSVPAIDPSGRVGVHGTAAGMQASYEKRQRQRARALLLVIKAKLESVESQVETFEEAFLANIVMADGATLYERLAEPISLEYREGKPMPMLLAGPSA